MLRPRLVTDLLLVSNLRLMRYLRLVCELRLLSDLRLGRRDLYYDVGWLPLYLGFEALFRVSSVSDSSDEPVTVYYGVRALDDVTVALLLPVLVVSVLVIVHVEAELV